MRARFSRLIFVAVHNEMKNRYRKFKRGWGTYYAFDNHTGGSKSLKTEDKREAQRLVDAMNEAEREVGIRKKVGLIYLTAADPLAAKRTWQTVMDTAAELAPAKSKTRWANAIRDKAFRELRHRLLIDTTADHFLAALKCGTVASNVYLRRLQNLAVDLHWLAEAVLNRKLFPKPVFKKKRAITFGEHQRIIERERNPERKIYYEVVWHTGAAQSDVALLDASSINWKDRVLTYARLKNGQVAQIRIGDEFAAILRKLPLSGPLFPNLRNVKEKDRATEFRQRCRGLGIEGVTLHSYRYSWAERAKAAGYPQRYAQGALGHASKAVTEAYAAGVEYVLPSLEEFEARHVNSGRTPAKIESPEGEAEGDDQRQRVLDGKAFEIPPSRLALN
jgi:integrase